MVISHGDSDHSGGAASLAASHAPAWQLSSAPLPGARLCTAGQSWQWDGVTFEVLHPPRRYFELSGFSENDMSCVVKVSGRHGSALLTGDIERLGELSLLELSREALFSDIVLAPHHGSSGSSMAEWVSAVHPRMVMVSVGHRNRFGHPSAEVLKRYRAFGAEVRRTDREGGLHVKFAENGLTVSAARATGRRYWHAGR
jgi:competence protein ComEC